MKDANTWLLVTFLLLAGTKSQAELIPIENFTRLPSVTQVTISPDGKHLALVYNQNGEDLLAVLDSESKKEVGVFKVRDKRKNVDRVRWVSDRRLIYDATESYRSNRGKFDSGILFGVNVDGSDHRQILGFRGATWSRAMRDTAYGSHKIIDLLKNDNRRVLIAFYPWRKKPGRWKQDHKALTKVYLLNVYSGKIKKVLDLPYPRSTALTDRNGVVRFATASDKERNHLISYREGEKSAWQEFVIDGFEPTNITPLHFTKDNQQVYLTAEVDGETRALFLYYLETTEVKKIFHDRSANIRSVISDMRNDKVVAVETIESYPRYHYLDKADKMAKLHKTLIGGFAGQDIVINSMSRSGDSFVMYTYSDTQPAEYYLFETDKLNEGSYIFNTHPWIDPKSMAVSEAIDIKTRDGSTIHGYLTRPRMGSTGNLPMVVLPHGGPHGVRDYWGFDWEAQLLASRGYAVLQVNYRGSGGFGRRFEEAGYGQWGAKMQDDLTDATQALIDRKIADPKRICIFGASYGGYAALMGVVREPELYQCAIGSMGVYDLELMFQEGDILDLKSGLAYLRDVLGEHPDDLKSRSPVHNVDKIKADVLIIHGRKDRRVPITHAESLLKAFKSIGKPVDWLEIRNEGHGIADPENRLKVYTRILAFLDKNIGPVAADPE